LKCDGTGGACRRIIPSLGVRVGPVKEWVMAVRDSNGSELSDGDAVQVIKDLKVKGSSETLKRGTVFKNIRLTDDEEAIECGQGRNTVVLKTCFLKKA
jgi:protein PhnA